jgi:hypothetical protein
LKYGPRCERLSTPQHPTDTFRRSCIPPPTSPVYVSDLWETQVFQVGRWTYSIIHTPL